MFSCFGLEVGSESDYFCDIIKEYVLVMGKILKQFKYLFFGLGSNIETVSVGSEYFRDIIEKIFI